MPQALGPVVCAYDYRASDGTLVYQAVRYEPKDFRLRRPDGRGGWIHNLRGVVRIPYKLPDLEAALRQDPDATIFLIEGEKDADRLWDAGLIATTIAQGAGSWKQSAASMATTLHGRNVVILPDADDPGDKYAADAMRTLQSTSKSVRILRLPRLKHGKEHGEDVSDWFDRYEGSPKELMALVQRASEDVALEPSYRATPDGLCRIIQTSNGEDLIRLANFSAVIVAEVILDDSIEVQRMFEIEAHIGDVTRRIMMPAEHFAGMQWVVKNLGARAVVLPGQSTKDHVRTAIQMLSSNIVECRIFSHTGWRQVQGTWVYLHQNGATGADGAVPDIKVDLQGELRHFALPDPPVGDDAVEAIRASLGMIGCAPDDIVMPIFAAIWRAPLGQADFSLHLAGQTGEGKSELAALAQQHFGEAMNARHLPASWSSSANALEALGFATKDALVVVDDFLHTGGTNDVQRMHRDADRVLRALGNGSGRQRMRADTTLRPAKPPRCLFLSTGEDVPRGTSLRARMLILELVPGDIKWTQVSSCQRAAAAGHYARAMAGYLAWLARHYADVSARLRHEMVELREQAVASGRHRRTPEVIANLALGMRYFLQYALEAGAITRKEYDTCWRRAWSALGQAAARQTQYQLAGDPVERFFDLLRAALATGDAHVADVHGHKPGRSEEAWGWQRRTPEVEAQPRAYGGDEWVPRGRRIGWSDGDDLYLEPDASFAVTERLGRNTGDPLLVTGQTLRRRLHDRKLLASVEEPRGTVTIRRIFEGQQRSVLHLKAGVLFPSEEPDKPDKNHVAPPADAGASEIRRVSVSGLQHERDRVVENPTSAIPELNGADAQFVGFVGFAMQRELNHVENTAALTLMSGHVRNPTMNSTDSPDNARLAPPERDCYRCGRRCWQWDPDRGAWSCSAQSRQLREVLSRREAE